VSGAKKYLASLASALAPNYLGDAHAVAGSGSFTTTPPSGVAVGDRLLIAFGGTFTVSAVPSPWTLVTAATFGESLRIYTAVHDGSASWAWTASAAPRWICLGFSPSTVDVSNSQGNASGTSVPAPSITPTVTNRLVFFARAAGNSAWTPPSGFTTRRDSAATGAASMHASDATAAAGATGIKTATISVAAFNLAGLVALKV
jgi:hypothetical protein